MVTISRTRAKKSQTVKQLSFLTKVVQIVTVGWLAFFVWSNFGPLSSSVSLTSSSTEQNEVLGSNNNLGKEVPNSTNNGNGGVRGATGGSGERKPIKAGITEKLKQAQAAITEKANNSNQTEKKPVLVEKKQPIFDVGKAPIKPSKPLRTTNQEIISSAHMVELSFIDISDGHTEHPHRGATDENGNFGYKHDEKALKNNPPTFQVTKEEVHCDNHDANYKMLTEKVHVDITSHEAREREADLHDGKPRAKIFCMVYTIEKNHDKIPIIRETWGPKCDGFIVASDKTDKELGTVNIPHEGPEEYHNIWQKVRSMWSYVYDTYYEEYDWFHIGGDDLYIIVENLRLYLESEEVQLAANGGEFLPNGTEKEQLPLFLGRRFAEQGNYDRIFNSGGSGYTLNKAALKSLVVDAFPVCMPHLKTFAEDVMVAQCLRNKIHVYPFDTKDDNGGERYMPFQVRFGLF